MAHKRSMSANEQTIRRYFAMWYAGQTDGLEDIFASNVVYCESHGPEYRGLSQIRQWVKEREKNGKVIEWEIKRCFDNGVMLAAEWYFVFERDGAKQGYDGATIARFDLSGKIKEIREYRSDWSHIFPYGKPE